MQMLPHLHQYLYDWVEEGERGDDDEVVDAALEGELLPEAAHRGSLFHSSRKLFASLLATSQSADARCAMTKSI